MKIWTENKNNFLKNNYKILGVQKCAKILNASAGAILHQASRLGLGTIKKITWNQEIIDILKANYPEKGMKYCSKLTGINAKTIGHKAREIGLKRNKRRIWTEDKDKFLLENYYDKGRKFCAEQLKISIVSVAGRANILGLKVSNELRTKIRASISSHPRPSICGVKPNYFLSLSTKEIAYILGILWADGYLNNISQSCRIAIEIIKEDMDSIINIFQSVGKWSVYNRQRENRKAQCMLMISNKLIYTFLAEHGYEAKTNGSADKILSKIPENLKRFWWRGYFDGDGCFYINPKKCYQMSFAGGYDQDWSFVENLLKELKIKYKICRRTQITKYNKINHSSVVRVANKKDVITFGKYLYGEYFDGVGFQRKYDKFDMICKS